MKKSDLKTGMRVEFRNGDIYLVIKDIESRNNGHQEFAFVNTGGFMSGEFYTDGLLRDMYKSEYDVMKVYTIAKDDKMCLLRSDILNLDKRYLIWEREEYKEMTLEEIEKVLGHKVKLVNK